MGSVLNLRSPGGLTRLFPILVLLLSLVMGALPESLVAEENQGSENRASRNASQEKPIVVMIHADWCGTCKSLKPTWERIQTDFSDQATAISLDVSDRSAYAESVSVAEGLGISSFFHTYRRRTGTIAVLACKTREPVAILAGERDLEPYRSALSKAACEAS